MKWIITHQCNTNSEVRQIAVDNEDNLLFVKDSCLWMLKNNNSKPIQLNINDNHQYGVQGVVWGGDKLFYYCEHDSFGWINDDPSRIRGYCIDTNKYCIVTGIIRPNNYFWEAPVKDGPTSRATFRAPEYITKDMFGNLYVIDNHAIRKIDMKAQMVTTEKTIDELRAIAVKDHFVYGLDYMCNLVRIDSQKNVICGNGAGKRDGGFSEAQFKHPKDLAFHKDGSILIADSNGVRRVDLQRKQVHTIMLTSTQQP